MAALGEIPASLNYQRPEVSRLTALPSSHRSASTSHHPIILPRKKSHRNALASAQSAASNRNVFPSSLKSACRSNPGTPTQVRRPDFIGVSEQNQAQAQSNKYYEQQQQQQLQQQQHLQQQQGVGSGYSPQRRFLSESELVRQANELPQYSRANNTVDNIRELAGSPQRGVYTWKDSSLGSGFTPSGASSTVAALAAAHQAAQQHQASMVSIG